MNFREYEDSVQSFVDIVLCNREIDSVKTLYGCSRLMEYGKRTEDNKILGFAYYYSGETYYQLNDTENFFQNITTALTYLQRIGEWELVARAYNILAISSAGRGNAPYALDYYLSGLAYCKEHHLDMMAAVIHMNIGTLYMGLQEYQTGQQYFERSYAFFKQHPEDENYYSHMANIYISIASSYLHREMLQRAQEYDKKVANECIPYLQEEEMLYIWCFEARLLNALGKTAERDTMIEKVQEKASNNLILMDIFDDVYEYCNMLLEIKKYQEFWTIINWMEKIAKRAKIINLQKRLLTLKIQYYKMNRENENYLQAAGMYFELSNLLERENNYIMRSMLIIRSSLEEAQKKRQEVEAENAILLHRAETDPLTGLSNRARLNIHAEEAFFRAYKNRTPLAVEIMDIDYFKQYNDNYGHQAGDSCLVKIAKAIRELEKYENVFCARYGGDEFMIIYEGYSQQQVSDMAEELKQNIMQENMEHLYSKALPIVTISQGICWDIPHSKNKVWDFLHSADTMLYRVKEKSRNSILMGRCGEE